MQTGVYTLINIKNGKIYIGSSKNITLRKKEHLYKLNKNKHHSITLQRAFNKYGRESFKFKILKICSEKQLLKQEQMLIDKHKSYLPDKGYNICKIAGRTTGYRHTDKFKKNASEQRKGCSFHTEYQIERIKEVHTNKIVSIKTRKKRARAVLQINISTGKIIKTYYSISEAYRQTGIFNIAGVVRGTQPTAGGFRWRYKYITDEEVSLLRKIEKQKQDNIKKGREKASKTISRKVNKIDIKTGIVIKTFSSALIAAASLKKKAGSIRDVCRGIQKTAYGFRWEYKK